jgi:hypothetical protein
MHVVLAYLFGLAFVPNALTYVEGCVPWEDIIVFLNTLGRSGVFEAHFEDPGFPQQMSGTGRQLPECWKNGRARCQPWQGVIDMMSRVIASEATG